MQRFRKYSLLIGALGMAAVVTGCAAESISYPTLGTAKKLDEKVLSSDEQKQVIRDLAAEQAQHQTAAIEEIEKSKQK